MARPTKLTREIHERIVALIRAGNFLETASAAAGIDPSTLRAWLRRGARESEGIYHDLARDVAKAEAEAEARDLMTIAKAGQKDWKALAWRLERRFPTKYGDRRRVELTGANGGPVAIDAAMSRVRGLSDNELERLIRGDMSVLSGSGGAGEAAEEEGE